MRALGLDLGSVRIGVALSDSEGRLAVPSATIGRSRNWETDHRTIADLVTESGAEIVVVGLPRSMDGTVGPAEKRTRSEVRSLERAVGVPVETYDERLSTVHATKMLHEAGFDTRQSRSRVDSSAAVVILQGWLDHVRHDQDTPGEPREP
ncbi:MAG: Holliday junction resolvase RuvX [Microthrixaceae bacterium]